MTGVALLASKLGIVYEPDSVDVMALARACRGHWPLVWVVDARTCDKQRQLLSRFGEVLDISLLSTRDVVAELRRREVGGLTTFADGSLESLAQIAAAADLPANSPAASRSLVDKLAERDALAAHGVPVPRYHAADGATPADEITAMLTEISYPVVIKPAVGTGGRDTVCVPDLPSVITGLAALGAARRGANFVIEECLGPYPPVPVGGVADYVSVEMACDGDRSEPLAITGRMPLAPPFRESGHFIPAGLNPAEASAVTQMARDAVRALGIRIGCLHVEIKLTDDGPRVIEVNGRPGGGGIRDLLCELGASDPYLLSGQLAMGESPEMIAAPEDGPLFYTFALQPPLDRPARLRPGWRAELDQLAGVRSVHLKSEAHTAVIGEGAYGYLLLVSGTVPDRAALLSTYAACTALIEPAES